MPAVTVPAPLSVALTTAAAAGPVELRDEAGRVLGHFTPQPVSLPAPPGERRPIPPDADPLVIPPHLRGPDLRMRNALAAAEARRAAGPPFSTPINDDDLREARAGGMYGDLE